MLYALDRINEDSTLLPDIKLGAILLDSCSSSTYALNQSLEFIRASINTVESSAFECKDKSTPRPKYGSKMIAGVIGGSYSEVSLQVANLLRLFRIPQVSIAPRLLAGRRRAANWQLIGSCCWVAAARLVAIVLGALGPLARHHHCHGRGRPDGHAKTICNSKYAPRRARPSVCPLGVSVFGAPARWRNGPTAGRNLFAKTTSQQWARVATKNELLNLFA